MGNAKSLRGGTLVMTPLKGADGQIYAQAQGNLLVGGAGAAAAGNKAVVNHLLAGRIVGGATVEREVPTALGQGAFVHYEMSNTDFGTTQRVVEVINREMGAGMAQAIDDLAAQNSPAYLNAQSILDSLLKAELAEREVRS